MSKVFVVNLPTTKEGYPLFDLTPAKKFGELVEVFPRGNQRRLSAAKSAELLHEAFKDLTRDDHLLLVGQLPLIAIAAAEAAYVLEGHLKLLVWDQGVYVPLEYDLNEYETENQDG